MAIKDRSIGPWGFVGVGAMVAVLFLYGASGLVAPLWAVALLLVAWLAMFVVTCMWFTPHPKRTLVMPIIAVVVWYCAITAGAVFLDWTA